MHTKNAELKAGLVVLVAAGVLLAFLWYAGGAESLFAKKRTIHVRFEQGYAAPVEGDAVYMNGFEVGKVIQVVQKTEIRTGAQLTPEDRARAKDREGKPEDVVSVREIYVLAVVRMPAGQVIPDGTTAEISLDVTGARTLALKPGVSLHDLSDEDTRINPIRATSAGGIADVARAVQALVEKVGRLVSHGDVVLDDVQAAIASAKKQIDLIDIAPLQRNLAEGAEEFRKTLAGIRERTEGILTKVSDAAGNVKGLTADAQETVKSVQEDLKKLLASLRSAADNLNAIVTRSGGKVDAILDDVDRAAKSVASAAKDLETLTPRAKGVITQAGAELDRALKLFTETGHNLADASEDLRAHPWLLLNKPPESEIAYENVRDAMRNHVKAAQTVEEAAADLKLLDGRDDLTEPERKELLDQALERLKAGLARYEETAQVLLRLLEPGAIPSKGSRPR